MHGNVVGTALSGLAASLGIAGWKQPQDDKWRSATGWFQVPSQWPATSDSHDVVSSECTPRNIHIAYHNEVDEMTVMWMTLRESCHAPVYYGQLESKHDLQSNHLAKQLTESTSGKVTSLAPSDMCGKPARNADYDRTWHHTAVLRGLRPGATYAYCVGTSGGSACNTFTSAPAVGARESFSFVMYGDMGVSKRQQGNSPGSAAVVAAVRREVEDHSARFVLHVGDISYGDGRGSVWQHFMADIEPVASRVPYMVAVGNHDYDFGKGKHKRDPSGAGKTKLPKWAREDASNGECGVALATRFHMPQRGEGKLQENAPFWYSYSHGSVHFVVISSEHSLKHGSEQWNWLAAHLAAVDRCATPWLVLAIHRPLYVVHPHHANRKVAKHLRHHIEDLLLKYGVDVVASGHVHSHSRTCTVIDKECSPFCGGSVLHVITGSGGHKLSKISHHQPHWVEYASRSWGYSRFTVDESSPLGVSALTIEFIRADGSSVRDTVTLTNSLRRDRVCSYCYSRSRGLVVGSAAGAEPRLGACAPSTSLEDIEWLQEARLAREPPEWAAVLRDEMSREWMLQAGREMDAQSDDGRGDGGEGAWFVQGEIVQGSVGGLDEGQGEYADGDDVELLLP
eukprot:jgi/Ulvmu1/385/UM001_0392.1